MGSESKKGETPKIIRPREEAGEKEFQKYEWRFLELMRAIKNPNCREKLLTDEDIEVSLQELRISLVKIKNPKNKQLLANSEQSFDLIYQSIIDIVKQRYLIELKIVPPQRDPASRR